MNEHMITAPLRCEFCGHIQQSPPFSSIGAGGGVRIGVPCEVCDGPAMTIGRYGSRDRDGSLETVLKDASEAELRDIASAIALLESGATVEQVADAMESVGTPAARRLGSWIRAEGGMFSAVQAAAAAGALIVSILTVRAAMGDEPSHDVHIDRVVIQDDGQLTIVNESPSEGTERD